MKSRDLRPLIETMYEELILLLDESPVSHITTFDEVEDYIYKSFAYDKQNCCIWCVDDEDVVEFALNLTLIDEKQYEDYYLWKIFKLK